MDSHLRGNDVTCVSGSLRKYFAKVSACLKTLSDRHFIYGCHQQISKNKPVVSNTCWERGRHACIKCLKLKLYLNFPPFCLSCGQMRASRPRSRDACLKTVANHFLSFRNLNSISKLFLPPPQRGKVRMGVESLSFKQSAILTRTQPAHRRHTRA